MDETYTYRDLVEMGMVEDADGEWGGEYDSRDWPMTIDWYEALGAKKPVEKRELTQEELENGYEFPF